MRCKSCHKVLRNRKRRARYCDEICGSQYRKTKEYYEEIDNKNSTDSERWLLIGSSSSYNAMMEVHQMFK